MVQPESTIIKFAGSQFSLEAKPGSYPQEVSFVHHLLRWLDLLGVETGADVKAGVLINVGVWAHPSPPKAADSPS